MLRCSIVTRAAATAGLLARPTPLLLGSKGGTPKKKKNPLQIRRQVYGIHFKERYLRLEQWYYCPLCAEPKRQGEWCRREDCRQIKP